MKRTPLFNRTYELLAGLNNMVWLQQFAGSEISTLVQKLSPAELVQTTSAVFRGNPFSDRINISLAKFAEFRENLDQIAFSAAYASSYEHLAGHWETMMELLRDCGGRRWIPGNSNKREILLADSLRQSGYPPLLQELVDTFTYLRRRRNHYAHAANTINAGTQSFVATNGARLNAFWAKQPAINKVDFMSLDILVLDPQEVVGLLRVMLRLVSTIDAHIASQLDPAKVLRRQVLLWLTEAKAIRAAERAKTQSTGVPPVGSARLAKNQDTIATMAKYFSARFQHETGMKVTTAAIAGLLWDSRF